MRQHLSWLFKSSRWRKNLWSLDFALLKKQCTAICLHVVNIAFIEKCDHESLNSRCYNLLRPYECGRDMLQILDSVLLVNSLFHSTTNTRTATKEIKQSVAQRFGRQQHLNPGLLNFRECRLPFCRSALQRERVGWHGMYYERSYSTRS